jgi:hypothetical protein
MTRAEFVLQAHNRFERLFDALVDSARCERTMMVLLAGYVAVWTLYAAIAKGSQDIHIDMGEMVTWSREIVLGTPKHPPMGAWLVRAWFSLFPREDWAYYLFAMILPTVALWITWRVSRRYLPADKRVVGITLLTLVPFYNFHALKFNANAVLTPFWAATTWWFLRSIETRRVGWAALAGVAAAAAMLGKYWSIVLLAGLGAAALTDRRRDAYFSSPAPYVTLAAGTILLTPHVDWLIAHQLMPFTYATEEHAATVLTAINSAFGFIGSSVCYVAAPIVLSLFAAQPSVTAIRETLWPLEPERRTLVVAFAAPFLFATFIPVLLQVEIKPTWAISMMTLLPVVLLSSPLLTIPRAAAVRLLALAVVFPFVMVGVSPVIALVIHRGGVENYESDYRLVAREIERAWHAHIDKPLRIVGSTLVVNGVAFYLVSQPSAFDLGSPAQTPWVDDQLIWRDGMAMVCPASLDTCVRLMNGYAAYYHATDTEHVVVARRYFGKEDTPVEYEIAIIPPQSQ